MCVMQDLVHFFFFLRVFNVQMGNWTNAITLFFSLFMALWPSSCWVPSPLSAAPNDTSQQFTTDMFSHCKLMLNSEAESRGRSLGDFTFCSCVSAVTSQSSFGSILRYVFTHLVLKAHCVWFFFLCLLYLFIFCLTNLSNLSNLGWK